ncbi:sensor histidine kinase [Microbacterium sp. SORGH_AS_0888]|uniref:sensor histidine kinase n=1 Tax=Microbacterium sp. SORGH_AS_0888 TaxID=3041791 RepID=UPI0027D77685|nr:histidine kinase [Microbacterium sp. SORGH_AS_0888]
MFRSLSWPQRLFDVVIAVGFFLGFGVMIGRIDGMTVGQGLLASLLLSAALAVRRLSPVLALAAAWAAAILQMAMGLTPLPSDVAILGVLYAAAAYGSWTVFWLGLASSFVGAATISWYLVLLMPAVQGGHAGDPVSAFLVLLAALFALLLSWTAGALVRATRRARENREAQLRAEDEMAAEQERVRIARDMHDIVAHSLAVVIAQADGARYAAAADPAVADTALRTISSTARAALGDVRLLLTQLRHRQGDGPQPSLADLDDLFAQVQSTGIDLRVEIAPPAPADAPAAVQLAVYRIVQEALTNALRHGAPGPVHVRLAWHPGELELEVRNARDPIVARGAGHGIIGMSERAALVGGTLEAAPAGAEAFAVTARIPWQVAA